MNYIFLVGGFAESALLLHRVRTAFEHDGLRVVVPARPGLAVLRGAVLLGLGATDRFSTRIARFTYGVRVCETYDPANPAHRGRSTMQVISSGVPATKVLDVFSVIVRKGTKIKIDEMRRSVTLGCCDDAQRAVRFEFFLTPLAAVAWTTDASMARLGEITLPATAVDSLHLELFYGRTELLAVAVNERTGERRRVAVDYNFRAI